MVLIFWLFATPLAMALIYGYLTLQTDDDPNQTRPRLMLVALIVAVGLASILYRALWHSGLAQTAGLFIGIPVLLAVATVFVPARSAIGIAVKSVTIGLLVSLVFLWEGILCVAMSAPLFYVVAILIGSAADEIKSPSSESSTRRLSAWVVLAAMGPLSLEGTMPSMTVPREVTVAETRVVHATPADVARAIEQSPRFDRALPFYLSLGFPRPVLTQIADGTWIIRMRGGEMRLDGMEPRAGDLVLERDGHGPHFVSWRAVSDDSHMTHFLNWQASRVEWEPIDAGRTRVTWTLRYQRGLDPAWYFGPMQRYAVRLAAGYLIDAVATP